MRSGTLLVVGFLLSFACAQAQTDVAMSARRIVAARGCAFEKDVKLKPLANPFTSVTQLGLSEETSFNAPTLTPQYFTTGQKGEFTTEFSAGSDFLFKVPGSHLVCGLHHGDIR